MDRLKKRQTFALAPSIFQHLEALAVIDIEEGQSVDLPDGPEQNGAGLDHAQAADILIGIAELAAAGSDQQSIVASRAG